MKFKKIYEEDLEKVYKKVIENIPELKEIDIELEFNNGFPDSAGISVVNSKLYFFKGEIKIEPRIIIGYKWMMVNDDEKEAIIAHELGHYHRHSKYFNNNYKMKNFANWVLQSSGQRHKRHSKDTLLNWKLMHELYADSYAAKLGYGEKLKDHLQKFIHKKFGNVSPTSKKLTEKRIENLERILNENS